MAIPSASERVKTALNDMASNRGDSNSFPIPVSQGEIQSNGENVSITPSKQKSTPGTPRKKNKRKNPASTGTNSPASSVSVKNRFKHTKGMLPNSPSDSKKQKTALECIADNYTITNHTSSEEIINPPNCQSVASLPSTVITPMCNTSTTTVLLPRAQLTPHSHMQVLPSRATLVPGKVQSIAPCIACPHCHSPRTQNISSSLLKCTDCHRQYMPITPIDRGLTPVRPSSFYSGNLRMPSMPNTTGSPQTGKSQTVITKTASGARSRRKKLAETIDLVSDDDEKHTKNTPNNVEKNTSTLTSGATTASTTTSDSKSANSVPQPAILPTSSNVQNTVNHSTANTQATSTPSPCLSPAPSLSEKTPGEYKFHCNKAMFGELYGRTLSPTRVFENRIFLSLECTIYRENQRIQEKYTLSVGHNDVRQVLVYFGRVPSFIAIETADRFAEVACRRIGRQVLIPGSEDPKKRYIILALVNAFKDDNEASVELQFLIQCVSSWAKIRVLNLQEAELIINQAQLDVSQKELTYGKYSKPNGPVETRLIFPFPPKTGGIPVTNEDEACLQEGIYLNDIIIDFYLKYIFESLAPEEQKQTYIFNSYFYKRLTQRQNNKSTAEQMHNQVKKWTRNVNIFEKDFIVIPVNEHCHWYLVVICHPGLEETKNEEVEEKDEEEDDEEMEYFVKEEQSNTDEQVENTGSENGDVQDKEKPEEMPEKESEIKTSENGKEEASDANPTLESVDRDNPADDSVLQNDQNSVKESLVSNEDNSTKDSVDATKEKSDDSLSTAESRIMPKQAFERDEFRRPCILIFDSLIGSGHSRVFTNLRHYLSQEWVCRMKNEKPKLFDKSNMKGCYPKVPRQNNDCDCGVFLLQYAESFFKTRIKNYRVPMHLEKWFELEVVAKKRKVIQDLISDLAEKYRKTKR